MKLIWVEFFSCAYAKAIQVWFGGTQRGTTLIWGYTSTKRLRTPALGNKRQLWMETLITSWSFAFFSGIFRTSFEICSTVCDKESASSNKWSISSSSSATFSMNFSMLFQSDLTLSSDWSISFLIWSSNSNCLSSKILNLLMELKNR